VSLSSDGKDFVPEEIARRDFSSSFRGFDQTEVRAYLNRISAEMRALVDREALLQERLEAAELRASQAESPDEATLTAMLGEETAKILDAARSIAHEIRTKAETRTAQLVREAQEEATRLTQEADELKRSSSANAEAVAAAITEKAEANRDKMLAEANAEAERIVAEASSEAAALRESAEARAEARELEAETRLAEIDAEVEAAVEEGRRQGREMVAEAKLVRERILADLAQRRNAARGQLEQLRAARERLLEAYGVVRKTLDEATNELAVAMPEARRAAESAARRAASEAQAASVEEVEAEIELARMAGLLSPQEVSSPEADQASEMVPLLADDNAELEAIDDNAELEAIDDNAELEAAGLHPVESALVEHAPAVLDDMVARAEADTSLDDVEVVDLDETAVTELGETAVTELDEPAVDPGLEDVEADGEADSNDGPTPDDLATSEVALSDDSDFETEDAELEAGIDSLFARLRAQAPFPTETPNELGEDRHSSESDDVEGNQPGRGDNGRNDVSGSSSDDTGAGDDDDPDSAERFFELRDLALEGLSRRLVSLLKRELSDDENDKMDLARRLLAKEGPEAVVGTIDEHRLAYVAVVSAVLNEIAQAGAEFAVETASSDGYVSDAPSLPVPPEELADLAVELVDGFLVPLRNRLGELTDDLDEDESSELIRAAFRPWRAQMEAMGAATSHAVFNRGVFYALPESASVAWLNDNGLGPCPDGEDNALAGVLIKGEAFPTGHLHPPAHSRCCCLLVPVNR